MSEMTVNRELALHEKRNKVKDSAKRMIWVTFQKEGIHSYPLAASSAELQDVNFLAFPHRHIFHFTVAIEVTHNDRDIEFIQFKRWCESLYQAGTLTLSHMSCEMIADALYDKINEKYPNRDVMIDVSEDGENGCSINYNKAIKE